MAKTRGSGRPSSSTTHSSSPPAAAVPLSMSTPSSASPKPLAMVAGPPFVAPGADKPREPPSMASSSTEDTNDPEVTIEGSTGPTSPLPPQNKRKSRVSLRLVGKSTAKKQKTEQPEISAKAKLDGFRKRKIAKGMAIDIPWLTANSGEGLVELIEKQGWVDLFGEKFQNLIYQNELAEFYCHMSVGENDICTTIVKGEGLEFDAVQLGKILGVPAQGYAVHSKRGVLSLDYAEVKDLVALYSQGACTTATSFHQNALTPFHKLVYNLVRRSIVPRAQKRANVEVLDVIYMDMLVTGKQINFPLLMIRHMGYMQGGKQFSLPYAPLITTILEHYKVPLKSVGQQIGPADVMGEVTFNNLGIEIRNGEFFFAEDEPQDVEVGDTPEEQPREQGSVGTDLTSALHDFREAMLREFGKVHERIDTLDRRSGAIVIQVDGLTREVTRLRDSTTITTASLATSLVQNHAAVMKKLEEFKGATIEHEVEEEEEELAPEQPTDSTPAP